MLHLPRGVGVGGDVADLLHLQRALEAHRQADVAAEVEEELVVAVPLGDLTDLVVHGGDRLLDGVRHRLHLADQLVDDVLRERPAVLREPHAQQVHRGDLAGEGLGCRDPDLEPGAGVEHGVRVARGLTAHDVRQGQDRGTTLAGQPHGGQRVRGLARLGDPDHEIVGAHDRVAVAVLRGDVHLDGYPRPLLDRVAAHESRVVAGPAGDDDDAPDLRRQVCRQLELGEVDAVEARKAIRDRLGDRIRLLVDLLEHEGLVAALLGGVLVPLDRLALALDRLALGRLEARAGRIEGDHLAVLDELHVTRLVQECGNRGGDEGLVVAEADHQRALQPGGHELRRVVGVHRHEGVMATELGERLPDGRSQVAVVLALDEVGDDLGVGLGAEDVALRCELAAKLGVVLDDAVENDVDRVRRSRRADERSPR